MILDQIEPAQREKLEKYAGLVIEQNLVLNLTAFSDFDDFMVRHVQDSLAALPFIKGHAPGRLIDIGSGGGLPAIPLAVALPEWRVTSLESTGKKARFQEAVAKELELPNLQVVSERSEKMAHDFDFRESYDIVVARALAPLPILMELTLPFVRMGGFAIAWKGRRLEEELDKGMHAASKLGGELDQLIPYELTMPAGEVLNFRLVVFRKADATPDLYPRDPGAIKRKPLG